MTLAVPVPPAPLPGPDWLVSFRAAAADAAAGAEMPSAEAEVWRYSRIGELDLARFAPVAAPGASELAGGALEAVAAIGECAAVVVLQDGWPARVEVDDAWRAKGLQVGHIGEVLGDGVLGAVRGAPADALESLGDALCASPVGIVVPPGLEVTAPVVVIDWLARDGGLVSTRLVVRVGEDAGLSLVEWQGGADVLALALPFVEIDVARYGRLDHVAVQDRGSRTWQLARQVARVDAGGVLRAAQAGLGGEYARNRTDCRLEGRGASGMLSAAFFGERDQMLDFRTFQDHLAPDTTSNLLFKGALSGHSRSVYTGLIHVGPDARGTNAFQTNRNIKLSDHAWAESVPNLEIETNDVRCSHASTVGPVDEEQRFYLESRGVPTEEAERLIVTGFFAEVVESLPVPAVAPLIGARLAKRVGEVA